MIDAKAKDIFYNIRNIKRFKIIIRNINDSLFEIHRKIYQIQEPSCPNGGDGVKIENHKDKYFIVNELISEEMELIKEKQEYLDKVSKAEIYLSKLKDVCDESEFEFINELADGANLRDISRKYGYENPYRKAINLIKKS